MQSNSIIFVMSVFNMKLYNKCTLCKYGVALYKLQKNKMQLSLISRNQNVALMRAYPLVYMIICNSYVGAIH